jgi:hypothetical protein
MQLRPKDREAEKFMRMPHRAEVNFNAIEIELFIQAHFGVWNTKPKSLLITKETYSELG